MIQIFKIRRDNIRTELKHKSFVFPGGEVGVKLDKNHGFLGFGEWESNGAPKTTQVICAKIKNSQDLMELVMVVDAMERLKLDVTRTELFMPYVPYARQDRVCCEGEALSIKAFARIINSLGFSRVTIADPHSNVCEAVIDKVSVFPQLKIINSWHSVRYEIGQNSVFVSPDAGANKKTEALASYFNRHGFVRADKMRDLSTGEIKRTIVYCDDFEGSDVVFCDDIIDGGRTFIELAKACKAKNCGKIILYATHGIFSKGVDCLFEGGIDKIFTTDSYYDGGDARVNVFSLKDYFLDNFNY